MPITKSVKKALRQNLSRRERNIQRKKKIKKLLKEFKAEPSKSKLPGLYKVLDKAVKINLFKKNTVARKKSYLTKLLKNI